MIDYSRYKKAMVQAREALEQAAAVLKRKNVSADDRVKLSAELTEKAARLRKLAMTFAMEDMPATASKVRGKDKASRK